MQLTITLFSLLAATTQASHLLINNWCTQDIYVYQAQGDSCPYGSNGLCSTDPAVKPYIIPSGAGNHVGSLLTLDWIPSADYAKLPISVLIGSQQDMHNGFLLFNYGLQLPAKTADPAVIRWTLADKKEIFKKYNVKVTSTSPDVGKGSCQVVRCLAGSKVCSDRLLRIGGVGDHQCAAQPQDLWIDLCEPKNLFGRKTRDLGTGFDA